MAQNLYRYLTYEGEECVEFETNGRYKHKVIVNKSSWDQYLSRFSWTATMGTNKGQRVTIKTSINKQSQRLWRVIVEHEYDEIDYWGSTIDHKNNNTLDNRISNLRIYNNAILNATNINSKFKEDDMQYIHRQGRPTLNGYKIHYSLGGEAFFKNFSIIEYGTAQKALEEAKRYRDTVVLSERDNKIDNLIKKCRDVEFERGLKNKLIAGELEEVKETLKKYGLYFATEVESTIN